MSLKVPTGLKVSTGLEEFRDFMVTRATPEEILAFKASETAQARADELLDKNQEDVLTPDERFELEQMLEFDEWVRFLKIKAKRKLQGQ